MVHGVEQPHDLPLDFERMRNRDVAVEQVANRLRDDRLAVAGRAVDEQRVSGVDRRAELIEHALPEDEVLKGIAHATARRGVRRRLLPVVQVGDIARQRHRRNADILVVLEKDRDPRPARVGDAVSVRRGPRHRAADDLDLVLRFQRVDRGLDGREPQAEAPRELGAGQLAREVHVLQRELKEQVEREARLLEGYRRRRVRQHVWHVEMFGSHVNR